MSEEYEDDFENAYEEDFESDGELEVPALPQQLDQQQQADEDEDQPSTSASIRPDVHIWPSLSTSLHSPPSKGCRPAGPAMFGRSLFAADSGPTPSTSSTPSVSDSDTRILLQPPLPPLDDSQRRQAAASLRRSKQLQQQVKLCPSTQLDMLVLHPLGLYQQYSQGVGVYAGRAAAACQTRQLEQDIREQDVQTEQIEQQTGACQAPEDLYSSRGPAQQQQAGKSQQQRQPLPIDLLAASNPAFAEFLDWAVPQVLFELGRADAEAAAESSQASAAAGPAFAAVRTALQASSSSGRSGTASSSMQALLLGELQLSSRTAGDLLSGRPVVGLAGPPTPQSAAAAAAVISAVAGIPGAVASSHLLLACYGPVAMPEAAVAGELQHGLAGLGCLCVWDLLAASTQLPAAATAAAPAAVVAGLQGDVSVPHGVLQLLVSEGKPTCCCWGSGEAATLVLAGMEEGGICCWDLAEPNTAHSNAAQGARAPPQHTQPQQQQPASLVLPARRPSYSTEVPFLARDGFGTAAPTAALALASASTPHSSNTQDTNQAQLQGAAASMVLQDAGLAAGGVVALAAVASSASGSGGGSAGGGPVCRLVVLSAGGCVTLYSVMMGGAGSDVAVTDLGMRTGSRVWLVKVCEGLPLGMDVVKPPHLKRAPAPAATTTARDAGTKAAPDASTFSSNSSGGGGGLFSMQQQEVQAGFCLLLLPGATQQLLVGSAGGRVLKGTGLGAALTTPPHQYTSVQWRPGAGGSAIRPGSPGDTATVSDAGRGNSARLSGGGLDSGGVVGAVTSLAVCPLLPEALLAGHSCGRLALFSLKRSRPVWVWQHPEGAAVVAVRWLPQSCAFVAVFGSSHSSSGSLVAFRVASSFPQPSAFVGLRNQHCSSGSTAVYQDGQQDVSGSGSTARNAGGDAAAVTPCCIEVLSMAGGSCAVLTSCSSTAGSSSRGAPSERSLGSQHSSSSRRGQQGHCAKVAVAVGFSDGSSSLYQLGAGWGIEGQGGQQTELEALKALVACW